MVSALVPSLADPAIIALALLLEAAFGYPNALYRTIRHPVVWIGALIASLDRRLNPDPAGKAHRVRVRGAVALLLILLAVGVPSWAVQTWVLSTLPRPAAIAVLAALACPLLAQRSLFQHVRQVEAGLRQSLDEGRAAVAHIVGRNPQSLDHAAVARAAIESLAENFSDGVVAPAFWGTLLGLPGIALYKAINTADSMIGHRTPRHAAFGWAAARLDDLVNLPASRLAALLIVLAAVLPGGDGRAALRAVRRDAGRHRSPNAGWPEAAMAGALGLRLAGPRVYGEVRVEDAWMGDGRAEATADDIARALRIYRRACLAALAMAAAAAIAA
jgi:adenosylcobinamide-phosphate synthase